MHLKTKKIYWDCFLQSLIYHCNPPFKVRMNQQYLSCKFINSQRTTYLVYILM